MFGNIKKTVEIKDEDQYYYNVLMEKRIINPRDPLNPIVRQYLKVFRIVDYKKYFQCSQEEQIGYLKAMNYQGAELVHDPTFSAVVRPKPLVSTEQAFKEEKQASVISPMNIHVRKTQ